MRACCLYYPATPSKSLSRRALSCKIVKSTSVKSAARKRSRQPARVISSPPLPGVPLPVGDGERRREIGEAAFDARSTRRGGGGGERSNFGWPGEGGRVDDFFWNLRARVFPRDRIRDDIEIIRDKLEKAKLCALARYFHCYSTNLERNWRVTKLFIIQAVLER